MAILLEDRINELKQRVGKMKKEGKFFYLKTVENTSESRVLIDQKEKIMLNPISFRVLFVFFITPSFC